jgi:hypothetical protein
MSLKILASIVDLDRVRAGRSSAVSHPRNVVVIDLVR